MYFIDYNLKDSKVINNFIFFVSIFVSFELKKNKKRIVINNHKINRIFSLFLCI